ncbi:MAG: 6-bladed beta-propeller [Candidatus Aminicenantes bacterium]|nr:6-bladed beta-propeller [Candidatus Aminicenantes bacterium]
MRKLARFAWLALMVGIGAWAADQEKVFPLPEISSAYAVKAWSGRLYISDARTKDVLVYSLADAKLLGRIGKAGQGPGEFDSAPLIVPSADGLAAKSFSKLLFFSPEGVFRREAKGFGIDLMVSGFPVFPVETGYIGLPFVRGEDGQMNECIGRVYDQDWKPIRDFGVRFPSPTPPPPPPPGAKRGGSKQDVLLIKNCFDVVLAGGRLYQADSRLGLHLTVFDASGHQTGEIRVPVRPLDVPRAEKQRLLAHWREAMIKVLNEYNPIVPDAYPAFLAFRVDGSEIHAVTPASKNGRYEILTFDAAGKILRRGFFFPLEPSWGYLPEMNGHFDILDCRLYAVDYNEAAERYELRVTPLR